MTITPPALTEADRDAYRTEIDRLTAELAKYVSVEPTVAEEMAYLQGLNAALEDRATRVREYWFPWPGDHLAGDQLGISVHTRDGKTWAIRTQYEFGGLYVLAGGRWRQIREVPTMEAYCWTLEAAEELAPKLAAEEAAKFGPQVPKVRLVKDLAQVGEKVIRSTRELLSRVEVAS